jgi:hypothetical protein
VAVERLGGARERKLDTRSAGETVGRVGCTRCMCSTASGARCLVGWGQWLAGSLGRRSDGRCAPSRPPCSPLSVGISSMSIGTSYTLPPYHHASPSVAKSSLWIVEVVARLNAEGCVLPKENQHGARHQWSDMRRTTRSPIDLLACRLTNSDVSPVKPCDNS